MHISYGPLFSGYGFVTPQVMVKFGVRSVSEPCRDRLVECDAAPRYLADLEFPTAVPSVMLPTRTFWEKAMAIHVFCRQKQRRGERLSRHWYDLARLDDAGHAERAVGDRGIALSVARHKSMFFPEKDAARRRIGYETAVSGRLQLVPIGPTYDVLVNDYARMLEDGILLDDAEPYDQLIGRCADIEAHANGLRAYDWSRPRLG